MQFQKYLIFILFITTLAKGQVTPPIKIFKSLDYGAQNQNWMISQAKNKFIYVANNDGLLEFNGSEWNLFPSPNNSIIRSVKYINGRIYTGLYMDFGYWEKDKMGKLQYTSFLPNLKEEIIEDDQIWDIIEYKDWIVFQSFHKIYFYNERSKSFNSINSKGRITKIFKVNNEIYYHVLEEGVYQLISGKGIKIIDADNMNDDLIVGIYSLQDKLLLLSRNSGFYEYENGSVTKSLLARDLLLDYTVYTSIQLRDQSFVMGTIAHGLIHIDTDGSLRNQLDQKSGLSNNTVLSLFEDKEGNIWTGLDNGINRVNFSSPVNIYHDDEGVLGTVYAAKVLDDKLYLGTNQGLFYKELYSNHKFNFIDGTGGQVWCLEIFGDQLLCGHDTGTFQIKGVTANKIAKIEGTWQIKEVPNNKDLLIQGNYSGLTILEKDKDTWKFKNKIEGFDISARFFEFSKENEIWVNHEHKGVFKLKIDDDFQKVNKVNLSKTLSENKGAGLVKKGSSLAKFKYKIYYASEDGIFVYRDKNGDFTRDAILSNKFLAEPYVSGKLVADRDEKLWLFTKNSINYFSSNNIDNKLEISSVGVPSNLRNTMASYENVIHLGDERYLFGTTNGFLTIDLSRIHSRNDMVYINSVQLGLKNEEMLALEIGNKKPKTHEHSENNLVFSFSVPNYDMFMPTKYQYRLTPVYKDWSQWTENASVFYENLSPGNYSFEVRAKVGNELSENVATYPFLIKKPWYFSNWVLVGYLLTLGLIVLLIHRTYMRYYTKQKVKIVEENKKQLELSKLENEKKLMQMEFQQMEQDIESKNRELAISTMSIINKNELLTKIKNEILHTENASELNSVIKIIDDKLNKKEDWEFFKKAFNNADKDFLKRIKELHPNLTPNDLKVCTYLRLNLSSKEIAPLLNISVRSVEIKRYRLRKKMELAHEKSLVDHILEI